MKGTRACALFGLAALAGCGGGDELDDLRSEAYELTRQALVERVGESVIAEFPEIPSFEEFDMQDRTDADGEKMRSYSHESLSFRVYAGEDGEFGPNDNVHVLGEYAVYPGVPGEIDTDFMIDQILASEVLTGPEGNRIVAITSN